MKIHFFTHCIGRLESLTSAIRIELAETLSTTRVTLERSLMVKDSALLQAPRHTVAMSEHAPAVGVPSPAIRRPAQIPRDIVAVPGCPVVGRVIPLPAGMLV